MVTEDEVVGWHHRLNGQQFVHYLGDSEGQGSLECCSSWGHKEVDTTQRLNNSNTEVQVTIFFLVLFVFWCHI